MMKTAATIGLEVTAAWQGNIIANNGIVSPNAAEGRALGGQAIVSGATWTLLFVPYPDIFTRPPLPIFWAIPLPFPHRKRLLQAFL